MNKRIRQYSLLLLGLLHVSFCSWSQRAYTIARTDIPMEIDGELKEESWLSAEVASEFTMAYPAFGEISKYESFVRMRYDNDALYIGGQMYDPTPDSISYSLSQRDDYGNADWFAITLDPYANNINAFSFGVTAAGVECDALLFTESSDQSWNAVWRSAVKKQTYGWSFEMRIPFSAVRFPNKSIQTWNINMIRQVRRDREKSYWNPVNPEVFGEITQHGIMKGIINVKSPLRLSFTPYVTGYIENSYDAEQDKQTWGQRVTGGLDVKYGLNDAFTLDMTLIPDFGQTTSDKQVLNLGPFEVRFDENRPFFLEGTDLFRIGNVFYSRRIGATPFALNEVQSNLIADSQEEITSSPNIASLINGTKVSGRTKGGLGIGVFNSIEGRSYATIMDADSNSREALVHPLTNYSVLVLSQNLQNNGRVSFVNTNVMREGIYRDANVSVVETTLFSKNNKVRLTSGVKVSALFEDITPTMGHALDVSLRKVSGIWNYGLSYSEKSDKFNPNDLGFLANNNSRNYSANIRWNDYKAGKFALRKWASMSLFYEELYRPKLFSYANISADFAGTLKNFLTLGMNAGTNPFGEVNHFESRTFGKEVLFDPSFDVGGFFSSDYSKRFALDMRSSYKRMFNSEQGALSVSVSPRVRVSDRMFLVARSDWEFINRDYGYVRPYYQSTVPNEIIIGFRNRQITENSLQTEFIFTKRMGIDIRVRHYWQQVEYYDFKQLLSNGVMSETVYNLIIQEVGDLHNTSYNAFTVDVNFRWVFFPGSELRLVYKNNIFNSQNTILPSYFSTFDELFEQPQINSISMKLLMFVDAVYFKKKHKQL